MGEDLVPHLVYDLCTLTSLVCAILVMRSYRRARSVLALLAHKGYQVTRIGS